MLLVVAATLGVAPCSADATTDEARDADALVDWMSGTALVPYMERLPAELHEPFMDAYRELVRERFPESPVFFGFRRVLFVASR